MLTRTWFPLALLVTLAVVSVPPWLIYKGNTIASVCAIDVPAGSEAPPPTVAGDEPVQAANTAMEQSILGPSIKTVLKSSPSSEQEATEAKESLPESDDSLDDSRLTPSLQATIIANDLLMNDSAPAGEIAPPVPDPEVTSPPETDAPAPPRWARYTRTYYVKLSAEPGTDEARVQHVNVAQALMDLPGKVTIRHEFGRDSDDVLNVISFKLEGSGDGLEQVAALDGVVGIYPVRTRKRPKALPLGSLKLTRPTLKSAHVLTGVQAVHERLGLTGKGIKVGIIDTGIDYKHPALGGCFGHGCKVAFGYDFVGDDYDNGDTDKDTPKPDRDPMDCAGHGTHVAGIVAAQNEGDAAGGLQNFVGVAPEATLGAYRVFGCEGEVSDDVLLAALKMAYRDGMDVVNLSLGGASGWPEEPFAVACSAYIQKGMHISIANGNDGDQGLFEDGAPATAAGAIAVGSVDNTHFLGPAAVVSWQPVDSRGRIHSATARGISDTFSIGMAMGSDSEDVSLVSFSKDTVYVIHAPTGDAETGCKAYPAGFENSLEGQGPPVARQNIIVLLRRGGCTFNDKAQNVAVAKMGGLLVYDIIPEQRPLGMAVTGVNISAAGLSFEDATLILNALKKGPHDSGGSRLTARFSATDQVIPLASGGKISDFSSWGPDARLKYKPDVVSPGGMIYSTFPLAKGGFATLQGTSMASPYMAGVQALFLERYGKTDPNKLLKFLQSTAVPTIRPGSPTSLTSVFQQGGGLIALERLFTTDLPTVLTPTALYLNDTQFQNLEHKITFLNPSKSSTRTWSLVHRPASSVNGFEEGNNFSPINASRLRTSEEGASDATMDPPQLTLLPGETGTVTIRISPPSTLNIDERWLYSGFLDFICQSSISGGPSEKCDSSLVSYGGMHGRLSEIPILNPTQAYPALQLDRYAKGDGATTSGSDPTPNNGAHHQHHHNRQRNPSGQVRIQQDVQAEQQEQFSSPSENKSVAGDKKKKGHKKEKGNKNLFRDRDETVMVGKNEQDWVQILISVNFPTGLLTIEAESVCEGDYDQGSGRIRLEIGGSGVSRFQIETEEELEEAQKLLQAGEENSTNPEELELIKAKLALSEELAFMPGGLYMPYEGYSRVMVQSPKIDSQQDQAVQLHRKQKSGKSKKARKGKSTAPNRKGKSTKAKKQYSFRSQAHKKKDNLKSKKLNGGDNKARKRGQSHNGKAPSKDQHRKKTPAPAAPKPRTGARTACVPRILGIIPDGYNPWSTRTDSSEGNAVQTFSWMGDLLLENPSARGDDDSEGGGDQNDGPGQNQVQRNVQESKHELGPGGHGHGEHKKKKKHPAAKPDKDAQSEKSRDLPDGRYRLVVKVLKPWGVRGRATDVERWSSPVIVIKRKK
ncbi:hypothetical protein BGZ52_010819 [Haplosporangium bisporale]|nr:hypothetical protein BGZ52_010819 [Haplosporangium bisporale]